MAALLAMPAEAGLFGSDPVPPAAIPGTSARQAQFADPAQMAVRIDNLEAQMRQLNGRLDELMHQNQVLQNLLQRMQEDNEFRFQQLEGGKPAGGARKSEAKPVPGLAPADDTSVADVAPPPADLGNGFSIDAPASGTTLTADNSGGFGTPPQPLGTLPGGVADAGAPSASAVGGPLDLSAIARGEPASVPLAGSGDIGLPGVSTGNGGLPPPPQLTPPAGVPTGADTRLAALDTATTDPRSAYDKAYSYIVSGDYQSAEASFRKFLADYPGDKQAGNAHYWLGESYFSRGQYRDAATSFLSTYKDYPRSQKAPDSLFKLGLSLENLGETTAACATYGELTRKYAKAQAALLTRVAKQRASLGCE